MTIPINGAVHSWQSIETKGDGVVLPALQGLDYEQPLSRKFVYGSPAQPIGRTLGKLEPKASVKFLKQDFHDMIKRLGAGWMTKEFELVINYQANPGDEIITDTLCRCTIMGPKTSGQPGEDPTIVECDLHVMLVKWSDIDPVEAMLPV